VIIKSDKFDSFTRCAVHIELMTLLIKLKDDIRELVVLVHGTGVKIMIAFHVHQK